MNNTMMTKAWPLPALFTWCLAWCVWLLSRQVLPHQWALALALLAGAACSWFGQTAARRWLMFWGFPVSWLLSTHAGTLALSSWMWLLLLCLTLGLYPPSTWRNAPLFPTNLNALDALAALVQLGPQNKVLDVGCGLGHGLDALRRTFPHAQLHGVEYSRLLQWVCQWRCPFAHVECADMWRISWHGHGLIYAYQRPEVMHKVWDKATQECSPNTWLVSLEFEVPHVHPAGQFLTPAGKQVWVYRVPIKSIQNEWHTP
jgi:hypothetical protein